MGYKGLKLGIGARNRSKDLKTRLACQLNFRELTVLKHKMNLHALKKPPIELF